MEWASGAAVRCEDGDAVPWGLVGGMSVAVVPSGEAIADDGACAVVLGMLCPAATIPGGTAVAVAILADGPVIRAGGVFS